MAKQQEALSNDSEVVTEPDDGLNAEERAQFEEMQAQEPTLVPDAPDAGEGGDKPDADKAAADAAAAAAKPAGEEGAEPDGDDDGDEKPDAADPNAKLPRRVSYKKFARTEAELNELKTKLAEESNKQARLDERLKIINEALATRPGDAADKKAEDDDPEPNPEEDFFGHAQWLKRQLQHTNEKLAKFEQGQQTTAQETALADAYRTDAAAFAAREPNFVPAYQFLMQSRTIELAQYFFGKDLTAEGATLAPQEVLKIKQAVAEEENALAAQALQKGQSPAARVFAIAKARGFRPQAAAAADAGKTAADAAATGTEKPNGAAAANGTAKPAATAGAPGSLAATSEAKPSVTDEIARVKAGQEASLSLSNGGGAPNDPMTAERLANMPEDEFQRWVETHSDAEFARIAGG